MDIRQLQYFISAAKHLNFTRAAEECCIVQSAMTQQIAALEKELKVKLFESRRKDMRLTQEGEVLYQEAQHLVQGLERTIEKVQGISGGYQETLRIGYHGNMMHKDLPGILKKLRSCYPQVRPRLHQEKVIRAIELLKKETIDCMFCIYWPNLAVEDGIECRVVKSAVTKLAVSADHPLADKKHIKLEDLKNEQFLFLDGKELSNGLQNLAMKGFIPKIYDRVSGHDSLMALVESGYGVALCIETACPEGNHNLTFLNVEDIQEEKQICMAWKKESRRMRPEYLELVWEYYGLD